MSISNLTYEDLEQLLAVTSKEEFLSLLMEAPEEAYKSSETWTFLPSEVSTSTLIPNSTSFFTVSGRILTLFSDSFSLGKNICTFMNCYLMLGALFNLTQYGESRLTLL